jgi:hypothetical protein
MTDERRERIVRACLAEAYGEPGYAVALIYHKIVSELERRRAVNRLWYILEDRHERRAFERGENRCDR